MSPATKLMSFWGTTMASARDPSRSSVHDKTVQISMASGMERLGFFTASVCTAAISIPDMITMTPARNARLSRLSRFGIKLFSVNEISMGLP